METIKNLDGRQDPKAAYVEISGADFDAHSNVVDLKAPPNSEIVAGHINVVEAFDAATTDVVKVGDSSNDARYLANTNVKATGRTAVTPTGFVMGDASGSTQTLRITRTPTGAKTTAGKLRVYLAYVKLGRAETTQD